MSKPEHQVDDLPAAGESAVAGLLRKAGPRPVPPAAAREQVRERVRAEWQAVVDARAAQRRRSGWWRAAAAAGIVAVFAGWLTTQTLVTEPERVATAGPVIGDVQVADGEIWRSVTPGMALPAGAVLRTGPGGRAALALDPATGLRLDAGSRVVLAASERVVLEAGAAYLDAQPGGRGGPLVIDTPFGAVRHVGTQYEVRLGSDHARVRVREGRVQLSRDGRDFAAAAGEALTVGANVAGVRREAVATWGPDWAWTGEVAPAFAIDGRPLAEFLAWAARESGRELEFASPAAAREARATILGGDITGLSPELALQTVMATTRFQERAQDGRLIVDLTSGPVE